MSITFHDGPNLSGRSDALKVAAWGAGHDLGGIYLQPNAPANFSGLAHTVGGERILHGLHEAQPVQQDAAALELVQDLPSEQRLLTLSGGQQARLALACALAKDTPVLAIDGLLEQLDTDARGRLTKTLAMRSAVALSDNYGAPFSNLAVTIVRHHHTIEVRSVNAALADLARSLHGSAVRAPTLEIENMSFRYGRKSAVFQEVNFRFSPGRPYLLKAPNGAGKSTLARILLGVEPFQAGHLLVDGTEYRPWKSNKNLIFYSFQNPRDQLFGPSLEHYFERLAAISEKRDTFTDGKLGVDPNQLLRFAALDRFADLEPFELPWFIAKRASVLAALVSRSPWLFFDEPSLGSDTDGRSSIALLVGKLAAAGFGIIIVSHGKEFDNLPEVERITIRGGRFVAGGG